MAKKVYTLQELQGMVEDDFEDHFDSKSIPQHDGDGTVSQSVICLPGCEIVVNNLVGCDNFTDMDASHQIEITDRKGKPFPIEGISDCGMVICSRKELWDNILKIAAAKVNIVGQSPTGLPDH